MPAQARMSPPPDCSNWPSIFWRPFLVCTFLVVTISIGLYSRFYCDPSFSLPISRIPVTGHFYVLPRHRALLPPRPPVGGGGVGDDLRRLWCKVCFDILNRLQISM